MTLNAVSSVRCQLRKCFAHVSFRDPVHPEKCQGIFIGVTEELLINSLRLPGAAKFAQGLVHEQSKIFVISGHGKPQRFEREETIEYDEVFPRRISLLGIQKDGTLSEQHIRAAVEHSLNTRIVTLSRDHLCIDLELSDLAVQPR